MVNPLFKIGARAVGTEPARLRRFCRSSVERQYGKSAGRTGSQGVTMQDREREHWDVPYEKPGPPKGEAYGMGAVTQALKGTDFPASKQDLVKKAGNETISWTKGGPKLKLADLINESPEDKFPSMANVVSAVATAARKSGIEDKDRR
jgi:hypothetical protein